MTPMPEPRPAIAPGMLNVLVATPLGAGGRGGIDRIMDELRREFAERPPADLAVSFVVTRGQGSIVRAPLHLARAIAAVARRPDVVHVNLSSHGSAVRKIALCRTARLLRVPYVLHLHGSRFRQYWEGAKGALRSEIDAMFLGAARILVLGSVWRDLVAAMTPEAASRVAILPNATRPPEPARLAAAAPREDVVILFLGRLGARKGVPQLIEALAGLDPGHWRCIIAGDGDVEGTRAEIARRGLGDRVSAPGWVGPSEVESLLGEADILVLPSFDENLPMSVIEAMAHGLAVVATPVGAVEDIVADGQTGLLVPPGDTEALRQALKRLVADPALRRRLGEAARSLHAARLAIGPYADALAGHWRAAAGASEARAGARRRAKGGA